MFKLLPSEFLSENEINAAELAYPQIDRNDYNPQQILWLGLRILQLHFHVDQLERMGAIDDAKKI